MEHEKRNRGLHISRLEAFCDGVFAIAITLLILEVKIPDHEDLVHHGGLALYLLHLWPSYFAFAFSFFVIGVYWVNHHYLSQFFTHTNHYFSMLTILFLMSMAFLPFPTALLGDFISDPEHRATSISFYIFGGLLFPAISWNLMWQYAIYKRRLLDKHLKDSFVRKLARLYLSSLVFIISVLILSFFFPRISFIIVIAVNLFFLKAPHKPEYDNV
jgi:uncharacterized membrane protein